MPEQTANPGPGADERTGTLDADSSSQIRPGVIGPFRFALLSLLVGVVAGLGAVVFRGMIAVIHNLFFLGRLSWTYDANVHTPANPWGAAVIFVPILGAIGVAFLVKNFAPEAKGHGVPEVMDAIYYSKGIIRPVVALIKSVASALSIGTGGSVGREGPIIQIGASFGSTLGQLIRMPMWERNALIAAGAGGGIAATFNTPVGGILFALELMMVEMSVRTLVPVTIATVTATYVGQLFFGSHPSFVIPAFERPYFQLSSPWVLASYVGLGLAAGVLSALFIKSIYRFEDLFERRVPGSYYVRHALGMLLVGVMMYAFLVASGHYYIEGVGYATIQDVLGGASLSVPFLLILLTAKLVTTSLTLGSGASGGVFSPSLFMGACLGAAYGLVLNWIVPQMNISPAAFAVAGMAGVVGGATGAALAAIVMIFEMTLDYSVIMPMTITVAVSYGTRILLLPDSIYTLKLTRRGRRIPQALLASIPYVRNAKELMDTHLVRMEVSDLLAAAARALKEDRRLHVLITDGNAIVGVLGPMGIMTAMETRGPGTPLGELAGKDFVVVSEDTTVFDVLSEMHRTKVRMALVQHRGAPLPAGIIGTLSQQQLGNAMAEAAELYSP
ncbi:MAG: chloride channel protein [Planctomycetaceae bacterium]|nr:chloride channel protein [Planctomycetaceae bacterium]